MGDCNELLLLTGREFYDFLNKEFGGKLSENTRLRYEPYPSWYYQSFGSSHKKVLHLTRYAYADLFITAGYAPEVDTVVVYRSAS